MDNKREVANQELGNSFEGNLVSLDNLVQDTNYVELPKSEDSADVGGGIVNNYNVNIDASTMGAAGANIINQRNTANQIVQNVLSSTPSGDPNEVKKNYNTDSKPDGDSNLVLIENGNDNIQMIESAMESGPIAPSLDIRQIDFLRPGTPTDYSYSESPIKSKDISMKMNYDILHSLTQGALSNYKEMSPIGKTVLNTEFSADMRESMINYYEENNIQVEESPNSIHESTSKASEDNQRMINEREKERDEALTQVARNQSRRTDSSEEFSEMRDESLPPGSGSITPIPEKQISGNGEFKNLVPRYGTNSMFVQKMNSPPSWRTVLG